MPSRLVQIADAHSCTEHASSLSLVAVKCTVNPKRANEQTPGMAVTPLMPGSIDENHGIQIQNRKALTEVSPSNSASYRTAVVLYRGTEYAVAGI